MKNLFRLDHYYPLTRLKKRIMGKIDYYYHDHRHHELIDNVTPTDKYFGRNQQILKDRIKIKNQTIRERREINLMIMLENLPNEIN